jgi:dTDP-4-dehydrorhamnose 3,5-epimerase
VAFLFENLAIPDVVKITPDVHGDQRGFFVEVYKQSDFVAAGIAADWQQFNRSRSGRNVLRGLHYQLAPHAQAKLVMPLAGDIFDVAVDLRQDSTTFGRWVGEALSADQHEALFVPCGFAHGFVVTSEQADILYYCDGEYELEAERGIIWNDADLNINWPIPQPILSAKDKEYPAFADAEYNF